MSIKFRISIIFALILFFMRAPSFADTASFLTRQALVDLKSEQGTGCQIYEYAKREKVCYFKIEKDSPKWIKQKKCQFIEMEKNKWGLVACWYSFDEKMNSKNIIGFLDKYTNVEKDKKLIGDKEIEPHEYTYVWKLKDYSLEINAQRPTAIYMHFLDTPSKGSY